MINEPMFWAWVAVGVVTMETIAVFAITMFARSAVRRVQEIEESIHNYFEPRWPPIPEPTCGDGTDYAKMGREVQQRIDSGALAADVSENVREYNRALQAATERPDKIGGPAGKWGKP